ncbi:MAG: hypothetical protein IKS54_11740 [Erysipelotrichaceae bacterium]|nr:hypothetical protein [Erysipelotrichaceae bacterium]
MTSLGLKIIAILSMLMDHVTSVFPNETLVSIDEIIGRLAFPLYAFMIVDSFRHLSGERMKKFMIILGAMAVISEPAFDRAFWGSFYFPYIQNQLLQFFSYGIALVFVRRLNANWQKALVWIVTILLNLKFSLGYGCGGIVLMLMYDWYLEHYSDKSTVWRFIAMSVIMLLAVVILAISVFFIYFGVAMLFEVSMEYIFDCLKAFAPILITIPFMALYNGEYGNIPKWFRVIYRYFYPVHIWILTLIVLLQ